MVSRISPATALVSLAALGILPGLKPGGRMGLHGMVLLSTGNEGVILSHIPMFHAPHDVQSLIQARFVGNLPTLGAKLYTLKPEAFSLDDLLTGRTKRIKGMLFEGNFEQESSRALQAVEIEAGAVVTAALLNHQNPPLKNLEYVLVGNRENAYLVHVVSAPPDFDQIIKVRRLPAEITDQALARGLRVDVPGKANVPGDRLRSGKVTVRAIEGHRPLRLEIQREVSSLAGPDFTSPVP